MINTNDFDKGYKDGLKQAREGKKKNFSDFSKLRAFFSSHALELLLGLAGLACRRGINPPAESESTLKDKARDRRQSPLCQTCL